MTTFRTTRRADGDIIDIYVFGVSHFGRSAAENYVAGLKRLLNLLSAHPGIARLRTEFTPHLRVHPYGSHIVIYREDAEGILVLRILAGAVDWERHIGGEA